MPSATSSPTQNTSLVRRLIIKLFLVSALTYLSLFLLFFVPKALARTDNQRDVVIYHNAARAVLDKEPLYIERPFYGPHTHPFDYLYPPPFAALISPLGLLDFVTFARLVFIISLFCWFGYAACLAHLAGYRITFFSVAGAAFVIGLVYGSLRAISLGQIDPVLWLIFGLAVVNAQRAAPKSALALAAASAVKIYSFWSLLALNKSPNHKKAWGMAAAFLAIAFLFGGLICGFDSYGQWANAVLPVAGQGSFNSDNWSLSMLGLRIARWLGWNYPGGPLQGWPRQWLTFAAIAGPLLTLYFSRRLAPEMRVALVGVAAAWCAPLCWTSYLPLFLTVLALVWRKIAPPELLHSQPSTTQPSVSA